MTDETVKAAANEKAARLDVHGANARAEQDCREDVPRRRGSHRVLGQAGGEERDAAELPERLAPLASGYQSGTLVA